MPLSKRQYVQAARSAKTPADGWDQNFASHGVILTGIYGNDSTVTFKGIEGTGKPQWVSFYYQSKCPRFDGRDRKRQQH